MMKKKVVLFTVFLAFLISPNIIAQNGWSYRSFKDDFFPKSPNAEGLARYVEYPVDKSSGALNLSIPIHTIKIRGFELPISLDYHTGGIKVDQQSTSVGLGWVLNAGGLITRTVQGTYPDERPNGYLTTQN